MKKNNLAVFVLIVGILICTQITIVNAQYVATDKQSVQITIFEDKSLQNYIKISLLSSAEQKKFFNEITAKDRSDLWRVHYAFFLVKHPDMNTGQREVVFDLIDITKPELYEISEGPASKSSIIQSFQILTSRAASLFSKSEVIELLFNVGGGKTDIDSLKKYQDLTFLSLAKYTSSFVEITAEEKSNFWRLNLALDLVRRDKLSKEQKQLITDFIFLLSPDKYEISEKNPDRKSRVEESILNFMERASVIFSTQEIAEIFFARNDPKPTSSTTSELTKPLCQCSQYISICDFAGGFCGGTYCYRLPIGCGPGGGFACDRFFCIID